MFIKADNGKIFLPELTEVLEYQKSPNLKKTGERKRGRKWAAF